MRRFRAYRAAMVALATVSGLPGVAFGQSSSPVAEALFDEARALYDQKRFDEACPKFRESDRLEPAIGSKFNLALCEEARGHVATAWALFRVVVEKLPPSDPRRPVAEEHRQALASRLPHVTIRLKQTAPPGTTAELGDVELSGPSFGTPLAMDPGQLTIRVRAPGHQDVTISVVVSEGQSSEVEVLPGPPVAATKPAAAPALVPLGPPASAATTADRGQEAPRVFTPTRIAAVTVGATGVVGWVVAGAFAAHASSQDRESLDLGCQGNACPPDAKQARLDALTAADRATFVGIVGTAFVAGGVLLWIVGAPDNRIQAGAQWTPDGAEIALRGSLP